MNLPKSMKAKKAPAPPLNERKAASAAFLSCIENLRGRAAARHLLKPASG